MELDLQEEFENSNYIDLLELKDTNDYGINLECFFDKDKRPEELLNIYIHKDYKDELFIVLNGCLNDISELCESWDNKIRVFTIISGEEQAVKKLKYNIVQLVISDNDAPDRKCEGNLLVSRKIIIKGKVEDKNKIFVDDNETIELPFHMIPLDVFSPDEVKVEKLRSLLPNNNTISELLEKENKKEQKTKKDDILKKNLKKEDFEKIKRWLET